LSVPIMSSVFSFCAFLAQRQCLALERILLVGRMETCFAIVFRVQFTSRFFDFVAVSRATEIEANRFTLGA
jgi:hypothetical protein